MATSTELNRRIRGILQFRLRTLLIAVTACGAAFAIMNVIGPIWSTLFIFMILLASFHVIGNALGTRLRDEAAANSAIDCDPPPTFPPATIAPPAVKRLAVHKPLGWGIAALTLCGALGGGALGEILFSGQATHAALIVGAISAGILGGLATFLASSFIRVGLAALWQAHCDKPAVATRGRSES